MGNLFSAMLLAVEEAPGQAPAGGGAAGQAPQGGLSQMLVFLMPIVLVMFVMQLFGNNPKKQQDRQLALLKGLKKNDPIVTIGGIRGNFVSLSEDGTEVTVQVAENMRMKFDPSAIRSVPQPKAAETPAKS